MSKSMHRLWFDSKRKIVLLCIFTSGLHIKLQILRKGQSITPTHRYIYPVTSSEGRSNYY